MLCPYCGKENANAFGYCNSCGKPMVLAAGVSPGAAPAPAFYPSQPKTMSPLGWVAILLTLGLTCFVAAIWPVPSGENDVGAFRTGVFVGALLLPLIVAFLAGGIKKRRNPNRFALVFFLVGIACISLAWMGSIETPEAHIVRLVREASGQQPVSKAFWEKDQQFDDLVRDQFRKMIQLNREFVELASKINEAEIKKVAKPESFVNLSYAEEGREQLRESYMLDQQLMQKVTEVGDNLRHAVDAANLPARTRTQFLEGFESSFAASMQKRRGLIDAEQAYEEAIDNLYDYATAHHAYLRVVDGHLRITNNSVRSEFNSRMRTYNDRRSDLLRVKEEFKRFQSATLSKFSISPKDVGLK